MSQVDELEKELERYARLDNTEFGEACMALVVLSRVVHYLGDPFETAVYQEVKDCLRAYKRTVRLVTETKTITRTFEYLEDIE